MLTLNSLLPVLDEFVYAGLNENLTIVAIDSLTGQLLGACINVIAVKSEKEETLDDLKDSVILSGSFNPLHEGHVKLLEHSMA